MSLAAAEALARSRLAAPLAAREGRILLAHAAGLDRSQAHRLTDAEVTGALLARYGALLDRRAGGEPVSRILGYRDFRDHRFRVTPDVLDPRPETESLVERALEAPFDRVLDLGTGSGCILVSLLAVRPDATGLGTDLSPAALDVAMANARAAGVAGRAAFLRADWWQGVRGRFDLIVSNPPYIAAAEIDGLDAEVRDHDPPAALSPGGDGLGAFRRIAAGAAAHLTPGGRLLVEIGWRQGPAVRELFRDAGLDGAVIHPDLEGRDRVVAARRG